MNPEQAAALLTAFAALVADAVAERMAVPAASSEQAARWLTVKQAAAYAKRGEAQVRELVLSGALSNVPGGRGWTIDRLELDAYLVSQKTYARPLLRRSA